MAVPLIDITQSIPDFQQWQQWFFQPQADNSPVSWTISGLPPGMSFDTATGRLSGAVTLAGIGSFTLTAHNADGASLPARFYYGCPAAAVPIAAGAIETIWDLRANVLSFPGIDPKVGPVVKRADDLFFQITFMRGTTVVDVDVQTICCKTRADGADAPLLTAGTFRKIGSGSNAIVLLYNPQTVTTAQLEDAAETVAPPTPDGEVADPAGTLLARGEFADLQAEITMTQARVWTGIGPDTPRVTTQTFPIRLVQNLSS